MEARLLVVSKYYAISFCYLFQTMEARLSIESKYPVLFLCTSIDLPNPYDY